MQLREIASSVSISSAILRACSSEASEKAPLETGGLFLGTRTADGTVTITDMIGPGPSAVHKRDSLEVDHDWQNAEVARVYAESDRTVGYVGEWHTHPSAASPRLSNLDKRTLLKLARFSPLRCPDPLMAIFYPADGVWAAGFWRIQSVAKILRIWTHVSVETVPVRSIS